MTATATALVLALVLAASHAEATCAWVLWSTRVTVTAVNPREDGLLDVQFDRPYPAAPVNAFTTREECVRNQEWRSEKLPTPIQIGTKYFDYTCLPDTIDPRGPKGGK